MLASFFNIEQKYGGPVAEERPEYLLVLPTTSKLEYGSLRLDHVCQRSLRE